MNVLVGSRNPVKVDATKEAFGLFFDAVEVIALEVSSGVSAQPVEDETFEGAEHRADRLRELNDALNLHAQFFVGIEGGIKKLRQRWFAFGAVCLIDACGRRGYGTTPFFELPNAVSAELVKRTGLELGDVMDRMTGAENTKQKQGAVGFFTRGVLSRKAYYVAGLTVALIPFLNPDLYFR
ncbi:MAG TPA: inosine/xanthosine triphosphatase [Methanomicrobia archaeon]|nr:inosine/xanthosine triphosphatase [Methanomicrobia archaeon]